jgi:UDP-N-acetylmuramoyl-tripeptide--D-alanyl-D-alanine ligase
MTPLKQILQIVNRAMAQLSRGLAWRWRARLEKTLYRLTAWHRCRLSGTAFIGVTGSLGKTTTKDLIAGVLTRHLGPGRQNPDSLNWPLDMVRVILGTRRRHRFCVTEMSGHAPGAMTLPLALVQPTVGVVTHIGADHLSEFRSREAIAHEKRQLIKALPTHGVAILNADDPLVLAMQAVCAGRTVTFGLSESSMLRGTHVQAAWPERLSLTATWRGESVRIQTQLCGSHWASAVLAAVATGVALGTPLAVAAQALADVAPFEGRMAPLMVRGITFMRDDWKAPLSTIAPAFEFMHGARARRKVIVMGTLSDYQGDASQRYVEIARQALAAADCVVFVGPRASAALRAKDAAQTPLQAFAHLQDAAAYLNAYLEPGDLVLLKGSHKADHLQRLILALTKSVQCWRMDCGLITPCHTCPQARVPSGDTAAYVPAAIRAMPAPNGLLAHPDTPWGTSATVVIGLGNPHASQQDTPHNAGYQTLDLLALRMAQTWHNANGLALVARGELSGLALCLIKPLAPMNHSGPVLATLAAQWDFEVHQCILVHDDMDLPLGTVRARLRGGDGGHRGVQSILQTFQNDRFRRVKVGVGQALAGQSAADFVLTPFSAPQKIDMTHASHNAADRVLALMREGA